VITVLLCRAVPLNAECWVPLHYTAQTFSKTG